MLKRVMTLTAYGGILLGAVLCLGTASWAPVVLFGLTPILWLDRWCVRPSRWPTRSPLRWEVVRRLVWFAGGILVIQLFWPRKNITWQEKLYLGAALSLATAFLQSALVLAGAAWRWGFGLQAPVRTNRFRWQETFIVCLMLVVLSPLGNLHPPHSLAPAVPSIPGAQVTTVAVPTSDGLELHGWLMTQSNPRGLLVFCHGHKGNCGEVGGFLPILAALRFNVLACDFRGHGGSPGHTASFGVHETRDVVAAARFLQQRYPHRPLFLAGNSYGAAMVLQALPEIPETKAVWVESSFARFEDVVDQFFHPVPRPFRTWITGFYDVLGWLDCGFRASDIHPIDRLQEAHVPICFCHGRLDALVPFSQAEALYACYAGPKSCLWIADGGHYALRRGHEQEYFTRFQAFLESHLAAAVSDRPDE
jgi:alpha-beta hydrolase superfamily lysophospholipase